MGTSNFLIMDKQHGRHIERT